MNKRIFAILLISVFLIVSVGFISAAEDSNDAGNASNLIKVKVVWDDNGNTSYRPDQVIVNLLLDGKVVEFINLNESNLWNATFKTQDDGGNYTVRLADNLSNYSVSYNGSAEKGFVINCTVNESLSDAGENGSSLENGTDNATDNNGTGDNAKDNKTNNGTDNNAKDKKASSNAAGSSIDNKKASGSADNSSNDNKKASGDSDNGSVDNKTSNQTSNETKDNSTPAKEEPNNGTGVVKYNKKPASNPDPQFSVNKLRNTGLPIIVVSLIAILGGYAYLRYRK